MVPAEAETEALRRIRACAASGDGLLDLGDLGLVRLPTEIGKLKHLRALGLGREKPTRKDEVVGWEWDYNRAESRLQDVSALAECTHLTSLNLCGCSQIQDLSVLTRLTGLMSLDLNWCEQLEDVSVLAGLTALASLNLRFCRPLRDLSGLAELAALTSLSLAGCVGLEDISALGGLAGLTSLHLDWCLKLRDVSALAGLTGLRFLNLSCCGSLAFSPVRPLLRGRLEWLLVFKTDWTDLPESLGERNFGNGLDALRAYYDDLDAGAVEDAEVKVFVLGNGRVGKSQLTRRMMGMPYDPEQASTHGVRLIEMPPDARGSDHPFQLNCWDFGGQELYHGSHALFLQGLGVFLLLWTPETESGTCEEAGLTLTNHPLDYWFDYLREMAGTRDGNGNVVVNNPVLLIQSKCEAKADERDPPIPPSRAEFPHLYTLSVSARTDRGLAGFRETLQEAVATLYARRKQPLIGVGRKRVREAIRAMQHAGEPKILSMADFEAECAKSGDVSSPRELLMYLHRTGVVFSWPGLFNDKIIVDQPRALEAIYTIFTRQDDLQRSIRQKQGRFTRDDLDRYVWKGKFPIAEQQLYVAMMEQCHLCFRVGWSGEYAAPDKLDAWSNDHGANYAYLLSRHPDAAVTAGYTFLHEGIVRTFLARLGHQAGDRGEFWKYGCCFYERNTGCRALVQCHPGRRADGAESGAICLRGWGPNAQELLTSLVQVLTRMPLGQRPSVEWTAGEAIRPDHDEEPGSLTRLHITLPKQVFVSYRHSDSAAVVSGLVGELIRRGWDVVWDQACVQTGDSISAFVERVRLIPFLVPVWGRTYHESRWCLSELFGWLEGQGCRFERLQERAVGVLLDGAEIDQAEHRVEHTTRLRNWCNARSRRAASMAPRDLELLQLMQAWYPRLARVLERLSDALLPRGDVAVARDSFHTLADALDARYEAATRR